MDPIVLGTVGLVVLFAMKFFAKSGSSGISLPTVNASGDEQPPGVAPWQAKMIADVLNEHKRKQSRAELVQMAQEAIEAEQQ